MNVQYHTTVVILFLTSTQQGEQQKSTGEPIIPTEVFNKTPQCLKVKIPPEFVKPLT